MAQMRLNDMSVRALKGSDKYETFFDTALPAFGVRVGKRRKTFVVVRGKSRERTTIGHFPELSVSDARAKARKLLASAPEPRATPSTFREAADRFLEEQYANSTSEWPRNVRSILVNHFNAWDHLKLDKITDEAVGDALGKIEGKSARLHAFRVIRTFFRWCTKPPRRFLRHSPTEGYDAPGKDTKRSRTLSDEELRAVWKASETGSRRIFRLIILWGTRSKETALLARRWAKDDTLVIPGFENGKRITKNGRDHAIPLLPLARDVLKASPPGPYYFPGRRGGDQPIRPGSLAKLRRDVQAESGTANWGAHDLRRTFRTNLARLKVPRDLAEILLNHAPGELEEIYDRWTYLPQKRRALAKHEAFLLGLLRSGTT